MKILYITTIGSTLAFFEEFIGELLDMGVSVEVACGNIESIPDFYQRRRIKLYKLSCTRKMLDYGNVIAISEINKIVKNNNYDIVHCHTPIAAACTRLACRALRKENRLKVVYTAHGFHFYAGAPIINWLIYYPIEKWLSRYTDLLITINKEDYKRAVIKMHAKKIAYISGVGFNYSRFACCSIDKVQKRREFGINQDDYLMISVGELNANKNHQIVIKALSRIKNKKIKYLIVGEGELENALKALAKKLNVQDRIIFTGYRTDVDELLCMSDVFIFPSIREGLPVSILEALACGLPLIATKIRGVVDIAYNIDVGYLVNSPDDVVGFVGSIKSMMENKDKSLLYSKNGKKVAKRFDYKKVNDRMCRLYRYLINNQ